MKQEGESGLGLECKLRIFSAQGLQIYELSISMPLQKPVLLPSHSPPSTEPTPSLYQDAGPCRTNHFSEAHHTPFALGVSTRCDTFLPSLLCPTLGPLMNECPAAASSPDRVFLLLTHLCCLRGGLPISPLSPEPQTRMFFQSRWSPLLIHQDRAVPCLSTFSGFRSTWR